MVSKEVTDSVSRKLGIKKSIGFGMEKKLIRFCSAFRYCHTLLPVHHGLPRSGNGQLWRREASLEDDQVVRSRNNQMLTKTIAKEVQATLPSHSKDVV